VSFKIPLYHKEKEYFSPPALIPSEYVPDTALPRGSSRHGAKAGARKEKNLTADLADLH
jgi:hypothetical protein